MQASDVGLQNLDAVRVAQSLIVTLRKSYPNDPVHTLAVLRRTADVSLNNFRQMRTNNEFFKSLLEGVPSEFEGQIIQLVSDPRIRDYIRLILHRDSILNSEGSVNIAHSSIVKAHILDMMNAAIDPNAKAAS